MRVSLLFYRGSGLAAGLVRWWTRSQFAHVAVCISAFAPPSGTVYEAVWGGVTCRAASAGDAAATRVLLPTLSAGKAIAFLQAQVGKPYDKTALACDVLARALPAGLHVYDSRQGEWDCSRLAAVAAGLDALGGRGPATPQDVYDLVTARPHSATKEI